MTSHMLCKVCCREALFTEPVSEKLKSPAQRKIRVALVIKRKKSTAELRRELIATGTVKEHQDCPGTQ